MILEAFSLETCRGGAISYASKNCAAFPSAWSRLAQSAIGYRNHLISSIAFLFHTWRTLVKNYPDHRCIGEVGLALTKNLAQLGVKDLITMDLRSMPAETGQYSLHIQGDILDKSLFARMVSEYEIVTIYHLAALLSTRGEFTPVAAHQVNVEGTLALLQLAAEQSEWRNEPVQFIFPSSIAAYGMPDLETRRGFALREWEWNYPITMYGCNKLYCEMLGTYFGKYYRQLAAERPVMPRLPLRAISWPDQRLYRSQWRDQRLRPRDDPTLLPRESPTPVLSVKMPKYRLWLCQMPSRPWCVWLKRHEHA
jgi:hypothetical protein